MEPLFGALEGLVALVTAPIPFLASSGLLLALFAGLWIALAVAIVREPARVGATWRRLRALPLLVQGVAWLLFLPVVAGVAVWHRPWPRSARWLLIAALGAWNLLVFLPA